MQGQGALHHPCLPWWALPALGAVRPFLAIPVPHPPAIPSAEFPQGIHPNVNGNGKGPIRLELEVVSGDAVSVFEEDARSTSSHCDPGLSRSNTKDMLKGRLTGQPVRAVGSDRADNPGILELCKPSAVETQEFVQF